MGMRGWTAATAAGVVLFSSGCAGSPEEAAPSDGMSASSTDNAESATPPDTGEVASVPCAGLDREPTAEEAALLTEPGPFAGDSLEADAEADAAAVAVLEQGPTTDEAMAESISAQIHGDYAATVCQMMLFSTDLGEAKAEPTAGGEPEDATESVGVNHFAVVLDASGSMAARAGSSTRMEEAKSAIRTFVADLPQDASVSLRVYGHRGDNTPAGKAASCASSAELFSGSPQARKFDKALAKVRPVGYTPLAKGIADAQEDIPQAATDAVMYVVSDGLETCGGNPVQAARKVADAGVQPVINVIGFQVKDADQTALQAVAKAGGGEYSTITSGADLDEYWDQEQDRWRDAWVAWRDAEVERLQETRRAKVADVRDLTDDLRADLRVELLAGYKVLSALQRQEAFRDGQHRADVAGLVSDHVQQGRDYASEFRSDVFELNDNYSTNLSATYGLASNRWTELYQDNTDR